MDDRPGHDLADYQPGVRGLHSDLGDGSGIISRQGSGDNSNIFDGITGNVGALGKGIRDSFGRIAP